MSIALPERVTCFSLDQPYAGLVAAGLKTIETRLFKWPAKARPFPASLLICSTKKPNQAAFGRLWTRIQLDHQEDYDLWRNGVALCMVNVVGDRPLVADDEPRSWFWDPTEPAGKRRALLLEGVRRVKPFPVSGLQGFARSVPRDAVEAAIAAYVERP